MRVQTFQIKIAEEGKKMRKKIRPMQNQNIDIKAPTRPKDLRTISEEEFQVYIKAWKDYTDSIGDKELERRGECRIKYYPR